MAMVSASVTPYRRRDREEEQSRVVVVMPKEEADAIDAWGVPAGMPSRTSAVRFLVKKGLESLYVERTNRAAE